MHVMLLTNNASILNTAYLWRYGSKLVINLLINKLVYSISEEKGKSCDLTLPPPESIESDDGPHSSKWVLVGMVGSSGLGTPERLTKLENLKQRRTEQGKTVVTYFSSGYINIGSPKLVLFPLSHLPHHSLRNIMTVANTNTFSIKPCYVSTHCHRVSR